eukprot:gene11049-23104_t
MPIGYHEQFTGTDWEKYSGVAGKITTIACFTISVISMIMKYNVGTGIWTLLVGLVIAIWEIPTIYYCIPNFDKAKEVCLETLRLKHPSLRGILYILLSIMCFTNKTPCIAVGILLILTSILYAFTAYNAYHDSNDPGLVARSDNESTTSGGGNKFGTF